MSIVSDALMPKMDGFALCRAWMQDAALKHIPFIFYSATYVRAEDEQFAEALGAVRYLIKPLEAKVFLRELREVLQQWAGHPRPPRPRRWTMSLPTRCTSRRSRARSRTRSRNWRRRTASCRRARRAFAA